MLQINKLDDKNIHMEGNYMDMNSASIYYATGNRAKGKDYIAIYRVGDHREIVREELSEVRINGVTSSDLDSALKELNGFIGNFSKGSGGVGPTPDPDIFSTEETLTNRIWKGKPVYRQVFEVGAVAAGDVQQINTGLNGVADKILPFSGSFELADGSIRTEVSTSTLASSSNGAYQILTLFKDKDILEVGVGASRGDIVSGDIVVEYTKL